ncbi:MAG: hypothetical protein HYX96_01225 [Chloroflexi bacterium]|nr:hypothetical protein [Chloroflexota bacterium]
MNLTDMRTILRRDLHDEDSAAYRWTDNELDRHIAHAVKDFSEHVPDEQKATLSTTAGSRYLSLSTLTGRVMVEAVEYPVDKYPRRYQPFTVWGESLTLIGDEVPDGANAGIYYGKLHTLDASTSTLPARLEDLVAVGAGGYAALEWALNAVNQVNAGGEAAPDKFLKWGEARLAAFRRELRRLGRRHRVRVRTLYQPQAHHVSKSTDFGPA